MAKTVSLQVTKKTRAIVRKKAARLGIGMWEVATEAIKKGLPKVRR